MTKHTTFWEKVDVRGPDECWEWKRTRLPSGYGTVKMGGKTKLAHRHALELKLGRPLTVKALHTCDNPPCCNPAHLWEGTLSENSRDKVAKGRQSGGNPPGQCQTRKLTDDDVRAVRALLAAGRTQQSVADEFSVSQGAVSHINNGRTFRGVV